MRKYRTLTFIQMTRIEGMAETGRYKKILARGIEGLCDQSRQTSQVLKKVLCGQNILSTVKGMAVTQHPFVEHFVFRH